MKILLLSLCLILTACNVKPGPLPGGAVDSVDANANEILQPAHAFALTLSNAVLSTDPNVHIELTAAQKSVLVTLNKSLNVADALEIAYHKTPSPANANAVVSASQTVQQNLASAQSIITVK